MGKMEIVGWVGRLGNWVAIYRESLINFIVQFLNIHLLCLAIRHLAGKQSSVPSLDCHGFTSQ